MSIVRYGRFCRASIAWRHAGHWLAEQRPIRRKPQLGAAPEWLPTFVLDVTADDFVLSTVVIPEEGELCVDLKLIPLGISFWLGPYPHIREFTKMIASGAGTSAYSALYDRVDSFRFARHPAASRRASHSSFPFLPEVLSLDSVPQLCGGGATSPRTKSLAA
jgi:hypothetical protein